MVMIPPSIDPQGDLLFGWTLQLLAEIAREQQATCSSHPWEDGDSPGQRHVSFLLWQLAANPDGKRKIGAWYTGAFGEHSKTFSFRITAHCANEWDAGKYVLGFTRYLSEHLLTGGYYGKAAQSLWAMEDNAKERNNLTTGRLAWFLEQFSLLHMWPPMPQELRDYQARYNTWKGIQMLETQEKKSHDPLDDYLSRHRAARH